MAGRLDHLEDHAHIHRIKIEKIAYLQCNKLLVLEIPAKPDRGEVTPSKLPDDMVSVMKKVTNLDRVVSSFNIVTGCFLLIIIGPKDLFLLLFFLKLCILQIHNPLIY